MTIAGEQGTESTAPRPSPHGTAPKRLVTGYNAAIDIDKHPPLSSVRAGQIVEFNPAALADPAQYMREVAAHGAFPAWYWVGANCIQGPDCDRLRTPLTNM